MSDSQNAYRQVFKATSLFSGVQFVKIIAAILRSKFAAIFIGPVGIGILGVLNSTLNLISGITKLGLDTSSIKEIALANKEENKNKVSKLIYILRRLLWVTGVFGTIITIVCSPILSEIAFESKEFTFSFIWISIAVLLRQLTIGDIAVLQGLRILRKLAKVNLVSSLFSVLIAIPLYYFFGIDGIVPTIILTALFAYLIARYYTYSIKTENTHLPLKEVLSNGKPMIKLGITLSVGSMITLIVAYIMQVYITNYGGLTEVGYYNAAIVIINSYVGLIFKAMSKDYFPRLSENINSDRAIRKNVTQQAMVAVLLITPIIVIFLALEPYIIQILYTKEFLPIHAFLSLAILGTLFKAVSWSMGYVIIAKGDSNVFIKTAIGFNLLLLAMNIYGYSSSGLFGLGLSFLIYYFIHLVVVSLIMKFRYKFNFDREFIWIFLACILFSIVAFVSTKIPSEFIKYITLVFLIISSSIFTIYNLDKKIGFKSFFRNK